MVNLLITVTFFLAVATSGLLALWVKPFLVLAAAAILIIATMRGTYRFDPMDGVVLALFALMLASVCWAIMPFYAATSLIIMALLPVFYLTGRLVDVSREGLIAVAAAVAAFPLGWVVMGQNVTFLPWLNVNQFALFVNLGLCLAVIRVLQDDKPAMWLCGCIAVMQMAVMLSESRSAATLCLLIPVLALVLVGWHGHWRKASVILASGLVFLIVVQGAALGILVDQTDLSGMQIRFMVWSGAVQAFAQNPFFGAGLGNFVAAYAPLRDATDPTSGLSAHHDILHLLVELGALGGVLVVGLVVLACRHAWRDKAVFLALAVFFAQGMMTTLWPHPAVLMFLALLLAVAVPRQGGGAIHPHGQKILWVCAMVWLGYTALVTLGGVEMRRAAFAMQNGDLQGLVTHLNAANHYYMPDDPRAEGWLAQIRQQLETLH